MRRALLTAGLGVLACCCTAPLAAQAEGAAPDPAESGGDALPAPGPIHPVSASETVWARGLAVTDPDAVVCLEEGEEVLLASDRITFHILGEGCFKVATAEENAFAEEQRALASQARDEVRQAYDEAIASGDQAAIDAAFARYSEAMQAAPQEEEWLDAVAREREAAIAQREAEASARMAPPSASPPSAAPPSPKSASAKRPTAPPRTRTGAARGSPPVAPARPVIFRLASGSNSVLARYPRGTIVQRTTALCLKQGEEATIVGSNGQSASYTGPGCARRDARPTRDNIGGFTFG